MRRYFSVAKQRHNGFMAITLQLDAARRRCTLQHKVLVTWERLEIAPSLPGIHRAGVADSQSTQVVVKNFVGHDSIVRKIWGNGDTVLLVFAGSAAEFALNRAVDWLFFTGKVPNDPIGRLFATAGYAQHIVFADELTASRTFDRIRSVHEAVERQRGQSIPDWAHRDVLYMLIDYSERAYELLERPLTTDEQRELYDVFFRVGTGLGVRDLPASYPEWRVDRDLHLRRDLVRGSGTSELYARYREHLGPWRYRLLLRVQAMLAPLHVRGLLHLGSAEWLRPFVRFYPALVRLGFRPMIRRLLMPAKYLAAVGNLDHTTPRETPRVGVVHASLPGIR